MGWLFSLGTMGLVTQNKGGDEMSDKQRADHVQAKYWNGFITRTETQKVFDEQAQVLMSQAMAIQKLDAVVSCLAEKAGVTAETVNAWVKQKTEEAQAAQAAEKQAPIENTQQEPSTIVLAS